MAIRNYLKVFADGHTEATVEKPTFGEVSATGDYYINGLWYDKLGVVYPTQFTYASQDDKLATFLVEDGQPVDITYDYDSPSIVQNVIQAGKVIWTDYESQMKFLQSDGVDYDDPDAIGANPVAKIYPDGTIVGSTDNGDYVKYPNGYTFCTRTFTTINLSDASVSYQLPIVFTSVYYGEISIADVNATDRNEINSKIPMSSVSLTAWRLWSVGGGSASQSADQTKAVATGRWKL